MNAELCGKNVIRPGRYIGPNYILRKLSYVNWVHSARTTYPNKAVAVIVSFANEPLAGRAARRNQLKYADFM
jgi:hypothetical protein